MGGKSFKTLKSCRVKFERLRARVETKRVCDVELDDMTRIGDLVARKKYSCVGL